ncbi:MAG: 2-C-methyl-D-erythritol 4-phosphate cytidylyltransferase [Acidimicrobiales bacterium]
MPGSVWAIVVAAGSGTRFGGPKQFAHISGRSVVELAIATVAPVADGVVVVVPADFDEESELLAAAGGIARPASDVSFQVAIASGRDTRAGSVRAGLELVPTDCEVVVVHDAARPLASAELCRSVVAAVRDGADGAIPGIPLADTVKRTSNGEVAETLERGVLVRVQTPQAFVAQLLRRAHERAPEATDDAGLVEALGGRVVVVPGEDSNMKITSPCDLDLAAWWHERLANGGGRVFLTEAN